MEYVKELHSKFTLASPTEHRNLSFIWEIQDIEIELENVFDFIAGRSSLFNMHGDYCNTFFRNTADETRDRAKSFLMMYIAKNFSHSNRINIAIDIVRYSIKEIFEKVFLLYISLTQDVQLFSQISWRGNSRVYSGDVIIEDIEMADWSYLQTIIGKSDIGIKLIPIKTYVNNKIDNAKEMGDKERQYKFLTNR